MTGKQRAGLRAMANTLETILYIGREGIGENTIREAEDALEARELIKGCVQQGCPLSAKEALEALCAELEAEPVQCIGSKLVLYKPNTEKPGIVLPKEK